MPRAGRRAAALGEEGFDDAVLERMEGNHDQASGGFEHPLGRGEAARQFAELIVDENPQRLEGARRRMNGAVARMHDTRDDLGQRSRRRRWRARRAL